MIDQLPSPSLALLGVPLQAMAFDAAVDNVLAMPRQGRRWSVHFCSVNTLVETARSDVVKQALSRDDAVNFMDGMPLVWLGRLRSIRGERASGPDVMPAVLDRSRSLGYSHVLYGGTESVVARLRENLCRRFPGVQIVDAISPPFRSLTAEEDADVVHRINRSRADFVWVALGSPKQDIWLADHRNELRAPVLLAVGAAFDFHSGDLQRAPRWMQRAGLEWLFRLLKEPTRLWRRYSVNNVTFLWLLMRETLGASMSKAFALRRTAG